MRKEVRTIMHAAGSADFANNIYTAVYASADVAGLIVNGNTVALGKSTELDLLVTSVGGTSTGVYLLGYSKNISSAPGIVRG